MTDQELQKWVEHISLHYFGKPFKHKAVFNKRLSATGGRYFTKTHHIDISWKQYEHYGKDEVEKIIKHELCHYHLHLEKRGYRHRDQEFKALLRQVGGSRFCKPLPEKKTKTQPYRYLLECLTCKAKYYRKRKMDVTRYACGRCKGKLKLSPIHPVE